MNLLEHYIKKIISEEKVQSPEGKEYYKVTAEVDCYGSVEILKDHIFNIGEWELAKKNGYFMA